MNASFRDMSTTAIRFWERGRIIYNTALLAVVTSVYAWHLPGSKAELSLDLLQALFVLAVLSNILFCAAYPVDIVIQASGLRAFRSRARWVLLIVGTLFACVFAEFISRGMFG